MTHGTHGPSRRRFLANSTAAGVGVWVGTSDAFAQGALQGVSPNEKLNIAVVGVGGRGRGNLRDVMHQNVVAICDVDGNMLAAAAKDVPNAKHYRDWRQMLDRQKDIDAVLCATPDHQHAHVTLSAIALGKHVYCEKPLTHTIEECRIVQKAAARAKVATQLGTQIHATENYRRVVELLQGGAIGKVSRVHVFVPTVWSGGGDRPQGSDPVPANLDWELWLGPAPERPYVASGRRGNNRADGGAYHPFGWRGWWDFGGGALADMACHHIDLSHWALGLRHPTTVEAKGPPVHPESCPTWMVVDYHYPARDEQPAVHLTWYHGGKRPAELEDPKFNLWKDGSLFVGDKGMLLTNYSKHLLLPEEQFKDYTRPSRSIPPSIGHHNEWIKACKEGTPTSCDFAYGGPLTEVPLLGNIAYRAEKRIEWDAARGRITNAPEAGRFIQKAYRKGWELPA